MQKDWFCTAFKVLLILVFLSLLSESIVKLAKNNLGTRIFIDSEGKPSFPSISICPWYYNMAEVNVKNVRDNISVNDIRNLPRIQDSINFQVALIDNLYAKG